MKMSSQDALWLTMDRPNNLMVIDTLLWFDAPLDLERVRAVVAERLIAKFEVFASRPEQTRTSWRWRPDPEFDIARHVRAVELPAPGTFDELKAWVAAQRSAPFDRDHPMWSITVVEGFTPHPGTQGSAALFRSHHAIADGVRLTQAMFSLCDVEGEPVAVGRALRRSTSPLAVTSSAAGTIASSMADSAATAARTAGRIVAAPVKRAGAALGDPLGTLAKAPGAARSAVGSVASAARNPARLTDAAKLISTDGNRPVNDISNTAKLLLAPPSVRTVWSGTPGEAKDVGWALDLPLDEVRAIGRATGTTVNDVLLGAVSGTLTRYLRSHDAEVPDEVLWMVPVSVKPFDPEHSTSLGNHFSLVALRLPLGIDDVAERLADIHSRMERIKSSDEPLLTYGVQRVISQSPRPVAVGLTNYFANKAVGVLTNVPGPRGPISFADTKVAGALGWAPCSGDQVMTICIFSYNGRVSVGFGTDAALIPDADRLGALLATEFESMVGSIKH